MKLFEEKENLSEKFKKFINKILRNVVPKKQKLVET
jgi:hypothetical protein